MIKFEQYENLFNKVNEIGGWLTSEEQECLFYIPQWVSGLPGPIVEIGSFKGKSSVVLATGCKVFKQKRLVYCIDPFQSHYDEKEYPDYDRFKQPYFNEFWRNIRRFKVQKFVKPIKRYSHEALGECPDIIAALFIDGDHRYDGVKYDITNYVPRVVKGGVIFFHDYHNQDVPGVKQAVDELISTGGFEVSGNCGSLIILKKAE